MGFGKALSLSPEDAVKWRSRIEINSIPITECGCWIWNGAVNRSGYGIIFYRKWARPNATAHRISYAAHRGDIPVGLGVLHRCDTPACVNPDHLFLGTNAENLRDMANKNRSPHGEQSWRAVLTEQIVREARASNKSTPYLAKYYGVNRRTLAYARSGRTWARVI